MSRPIYCDESVWLPVATGLDRRGWQVHHARDEGRLGDPDRDQLEFAASRDWLLLTFDDDFLALVADSELDHAGILYVDQFGRQIGDVVSVVDDFLADGDESARREIHYL